MKLLDVRILSLAAASIFLQNSLPAAGTSWTDTNPSDHAVAKNPSSARPLTFCNPIDIPYRFILKNNSDPHSPSSREAADPTMVFHNSEFWLFASKCGGYWRSKDMVHWDLIEGTGYPAEDYAPTVEFVEGKAVLVTSAGGAIYTCDDLAVGQWTKVRDIPPVADPALFHDDDGKLYLYSGSSPDKAIVGVELDPKNNFAFVGEAKPLIPGLDGVHHGWEARGPMGTDDQIIHEGYKPWMEGSWMTKHKGTYYLQYAAPGTDSKAYGDGVYTSDQPLGTYTYENYSPMSYKPTGFAGSAGHSSTYQDATGNWWRVTTQLVGDGYIFDRRLGIFPAGFLPNGDKPDQITTNTYLGDYPQFAPGFAKDPLGDNLVGWMLLSLKKPATASSVLDDGHQPDRAFDEDIHTSWAAKTGDPGEWLQVDLGKPCRIDAVQINFGDVKSTFYGRLQKDAYQYTLEVSDDGTTWMPCLDRHDNTRDAPHDYTALDKPVTARYAKLTNVHTPAGAVFSVSGLRLFGSGLGEAPEQVSSVIVERQDNRRLMKVSWQKSPHADFYIVRYGIKPDHLTLNDQVYDGESVTIPGLNTDPDYFVTVDAVNDTGVTKGTDVQSTASHP